jgi:hypothetical protein
MLGLSGIVLPPEPCGSNSNYHDPNRWHNHLSLPLMPAPIDMVHVPYRGGAPALTDLIAGQVQVMFPSNASAIEYIRAVCPLRRRGRLLPVVGRLPQYPESGRKVRASASVAMCH